MGLADRQSKEDGKKEEFVDHAIAFEGILSGIPRITDWREVLLRRDPGQYSV